ncbi:MAG: diacylglycerol kinase family lipid kinase [Patescibacteria group bacterium]|nr:diacylglycerol kinase family lipid kinase [Patescibacteria group bacterium]MDD5715283.1 diacylglycerol kinase family lipid kinase [Patescibacteria group bacterium]
MFKKYFFVINPAAGRGKKLAVVPRIQQYCRDNNIRFDTVITRRAGEGVDLARRAAHTYDAVIAVGGDGTVNEVVNGIVGTNAALGVIPIGSGNDFARQVGYSRSLRQCLSALRRGAVRNVDIGTVNDTRHFINAVGIGFDGEVASRVRQYLRFARGFSAYLLATLRTLATYRFRFIRIELDGGRVLEKKVLFAAVCNGTTYGGGFQVAPSAEIDDGMFTVCVVDQISRLYALRSIPKIMRGTHVSLPIVHTYTSKRVVLTSERPCAAQADGEIIEPGMRFAISLHPHQLRVITSIV